MGSDGAGTPYIFIMSKVSEREYVDLNMLSHFDNLHSPSFQLKPSAFLGGVSMGCRFIGGKTQNKLLLDFPWLQSL